MWRLIGFHLLLIIIIGIILFGSLLFLLEHFRGRYIKKRNWKSPNEYNIGRAGIILFYLFGLFIIILLSFFLIDFKIRGVP